MGGAELALIDNTKLNPDYNEIVSTVGASDAYIHWATLKDGTGLTIRAGGYSNVFAFAEPIDVGRYNTLTVTLNLSRDSVYSADYVMIGLSGDTKSTNFESPSTKIKDFPGEYKTYAVDISAITGKKYFKLLQHLNNNVNGNVTVSDIQFSK